MPIYEYECTTHGGFEAMRSLKEYRQREPCPQCGVAASRVVSSGVALAQMSSAVRTAYARNERSAHEPTSSKNLRHGKGCTCCSKAVSKNNTVIAANGAKAFPSKRPWMISH